MQPKARSSFQKVKINTTMKFLILFAVVVAAKAVPIVPGLVIAPNIISTGTSIQARAQDAVGNYNFGYSEGGATGGSFRKESGDVAGNKIGSYGLTDADGRQRIVNYVADGAGFRATVDTNEPGVDPSKDPAAVAINKGALIGAPLPGALAYSTLGLVSPLGLTAPINTVAPGIAISRPLISTYSGLII